MKAAEVQSQLEALAAERGADLELVESLVCGALPYLVPMLRRLADAAASGVFWPVRFIVRGALNGLVDALVDWADQTCNVQIEES